MPIAHSFRRRRLPADSGVRLEVCPPALLPSIESLRRRLARWLNPADPLPASPSATNRLQTVRDDFAACLNDIATTESRLLLAQIHHARTLRELWHLRAATFGLVAVHHSQYEATQRLARLNRHFPTRSPKSGFAPLEL